MNLMSERFSDFHVHTVYSDLDAMAANAIRRIASTLAVERCKLEIDGGKLSLLQFDDEGTVVRRVTGLENNADVVVR